MAKKNSPARQIVFGLLAAVGGWAAFALVRDFLVQAVWEGFFGITNSNLQNLFTLLAIVLVFWLSIGAPFSKKGFIKAFDKVL